MVQVHLTKVLRMTKVWHDNKGGCFDIPLTW